MTDYRKFSLSEEEENTKKLILEMLKKLGVLDIALLDDRYHCFYPDNPGGSLSIIHGSSDRKVVSVPTNCYSFALKISTFNETGAISYHGPSKKDHLLGILKSGMLVRDKYNGDSVSGRGIYSTPSFPVALCGYAPTVIYKNRKFRILFKLRHNYKSDTEIALTWGHNLEPNEKLRYEFFTKSPNDVQVYAILVREIKSEDKFVEHNPPPHHTNLETILLG